MLLSCCLLSQMGKNINFRYQAFQGQWLHFRGQVRKGQTGTSGWNITFTFSSHQCGNTLRIIKLHLSLTIICPDILPPSNSQLYNCSFPARRGLEEATPQPPLFTHLTLSTHPTITREIFWKYLASFHFLILKIICISPTVYSSGERSKAQAPRELQRTGTDFHKFSSQATLCPSPWFSITGKEKKIQANKPPAWFSRERTVVWERGYVINQFIPSFI